VKVIEPSQGVGVIIDIAADTLSIGDIGKIVKEPAFRRKQLVTAVILDDEANNAALHGC
jgi:hypothetical protein